MTRQVVLVFLACAVLVAGCQPPSSVGTASTPSTSASATAAPPTAATSASASPSAAVAFRDLTVTPASTLAGQHVLVMQMSSGTTTHVVVWDVPVDGTTPRAVVGYTQVGPSADRDYDYVSLSRQLSSDGRELVLSDPIEAAGRGLVVIDLVSGSARLVAIPGITNQPAWSFDGTTIAYRGASHGTTFAVDTGVWVVPASGGAPRQVATSDIAPGSGATLLFGWADARTVVYGQNGLKRVDTSTGAVTAMEGSLAGLTIAARAARPADVLVFDEGRPGAITGHVEVRDDIGSPGRIVARYGPGEGTFLMEPRWRPGSDEFLMFWAMGEGTAERDELGVINAVSGARRVIPTASYVRAATWTADGSQIVYASLTEVRVCNADGSDDHVLFRPVQSAGDTQLVTGVTAFAPSTR